MVHFFKLLLLFTGITCWGLVACEPSHGSISTDILSSNGFVGEAKAAQARLLEPEATHANLVSDWFSRLDDIDTERLTKWLVLGLLPVGVIGTAFYWRQFPIRHKLMGAAEQYTYTESSDSQRAQENTALKEAQDPVLPSRYETLSSGQSVSGQAAEPTLTRRSPSGVNGAQSPGSATSSAITRTSRIAKVDKVEALMADLRHPEATQRRKAIWELGQRGDSRAIQPLVNLLMDADSQQRSLILAALAEINTRALKPMHRALLVSLQDENADVRKNAIRDTTRIYEQMAQVSQLLQYAAGDSDAEVQETARWALGQLNRCRTSPGLEQVQPQPDCLPSCPNPNSEDSQRL